MSIKHICDCCGKEIGRALFHYKLTAPVSIDNLEICSGCFYRIRDEIRNSINQQKERIEE